MLLSVRDGICNTIQPRGLASIARKQGLSWQECARIVGLSAYELCRQGAVDGVIDFVPGEEPANLARALVSAVLAVEEDARQFAAAHPQFLDHYARSVQRFLQPSTELRKVQALSSLSLGSDPTSYLNVFGTVFRFTRHLGLRRRLKYATRSRYAALAAETAPATAARRAARQQGGLERWLAQPLVIRYDEELLAAWRAFTAKQHVLGEQRGALARFIFGNPRQNYRRTLRRLTLTCAFHLYTLWKADAPAQVRELMHWLRAQPLQRLPADGDLTVPDLLRTPAVRDDFLGECDNLLLFDAVYEGLLARMPLLARSAVREAAIPAPALQELLDAVFIDISSRTGGSVTAEVLATRFFQWLDLLQRHAGRVAWLRRTQAWKLQAHPRLAPPLVAMATYLCERLIPEYAAAQAGRGRYTGEVNLRDIGMRDFWHRLVRAYQDVLISEELLQAKRATPVTAEGLREAFFTEFRELDTDLMTADPARFPGFRESLAAALDKGITPCGIITGIGTLRAGGRQVGVVLSNAAFQAGAFDMASAEKFCRLLARCARASLPVVCFISSGGMQTKEGAGALFAMPLLNDRLTRFIRDHELPVICFGYGDCTGGAQASFVTHPLVQTYYFSGTNMPFAGQVVVPAHLPQEVTLSNYLAQTAGAMRGLVQHPFLPELDARLREIDPQIPVAQTTVAELITRIIAWDLLPAPAAAPEPPAEEEVLCRPLRKVLVHARGCAAVKIVLRAQALGLQVMLVQSDADMRSAAAQLLRPEDRLVCLGGNTPAESYLNARSVIRIAEREGADALHPGIGFLSESPEFAALVRRHHLVFIGPRVRSMELMGNKANAIATAQRLRIPVVPGSHGVVPDAATAAELAEHIGFPVLLKAVYGGGGKGIAVARSADKVREKFAAIATEAQNAFGNGDIYLEKYVESLRHIEVQVLRDRAGCTLVPGLRDCSVQRNNQKVVEESDSTLLPAHLRAEALRYAAAIADGIDYLGAGTVEFIYDLPAQALYFMEMNTRLQVEHPVTELVSGVDIVGAQFAIAAGGSIADLQPRAEGYAIEVRLNADRPVAAADGTLTLRPNAGTVTECMLPEADGITVLATLRRGGTVSPFYDSMVGQLIAHGQDRAQTIDRLAAYLATVRVEGVATNLALLRLILADATYRGGDYDTTFLPRLLARCNRAALVAATEAAAAQVPAADLAERIRIAGSDELRVVAPGAGVFYRTASPGEPELVREGETITPDQPLGYLEVMKTFTPLTLAQYRAGEQPLYPAARYTVVRISAAGGGQVNPGDLLCVVRPLTVQAELC